MSETVNIPNTTTFTKVGSAVSIFTEYDDRALPNITKAFIALLVGNQDDIPYSEGELMIQAKNYPTEIDFVINSKGQLVLTGDSCELKGYSIVNGYLIYTG